MSKGKEVDGGIRFEDCEAIAISRNQLNLLIRCDDFDEDLWVPQKCIHDDSECYRVGDKGTLVVMKWWAEKNELV